MHFLSRSNKRKIIFFGFLFLCQTTFAAELAPNTATISSCGDMSFRVEGNLFVKPDQKATYSITSNSILDQQAKVEYELREEDKLIQVVNDHQFTYLFTTPGTYLLKTILRRSEVCFQSNEQNITVAKQIRLGIWLDEQANSFLTQAIRNQWVWFLVHEWSSDLRDENETIKRIQQIALILPSSDVLFVEESQARLLFDHLDDMRTYGIWFPERIILVGNISTSALRRLLHQSPSITDFSEIAITPAPYLSSVIQVLLNEQPLEQLEVVRLMHPNEATTTRWLPLSKATDYLLIHGMSITFLLFLLCIPLVVLCLVILKQIVWFNVGGIYYLLLAAAANIFVWREVTLLMFFAALCGQLISQIITQRMYLLYAPKVWLTITLTCISFMGLSIALLWWWYPISLPTDPVYVFFPLMTFSLMMQYIYPSAISWTKLNWWIWFSQFIWWTILITVLLQRSRLQQFILWYPDSILLIIAAIIYLGRFAWLQIGEYIRFWPLVTKYFDDEE